LICKWHVTCHMLYVKKKKQSSRIFCSLKSRGSGHNNKRHKTVMHFLWENFSYRFTFLYVCLAVRDVRQIGRTCPFPNYCESLPRCVSAPGSQRGGGVGRGRAGAGADLVDGPGEGGGGGLVARDEEGDEVIPQLLAGATPPGSGGRVSSGLRNTTQLASRK